MRSLPLTVIYFILLILLMIIFIILYVTQFIIHLYPLKDLNFQKYLIIFMLCYYLLNYMMYEYSIVWNLFLSASN